MRDVGELSLIFQECLYANAVSMGSKEKKLEVYMPLEGYSLSEVTEMCWESSHDRSADGHRFSRRDTVKGMSGSYPYCDSSWNPWSSAWGEQ